LELKPSPNYAFHSLSDLITDIVIYFPHGFGELPPYQDHPYGHARAETIGTIVVGLLIIFRGLGIAYESWETISDPIKKAPIWFSPPVLHAFPLL
jgi:divalent metal cation (Fe/Co/Zn/Cd) transporter